MKNKTETFIEKAVKRHGDKYDYSMVDYKHCMQKVKIICRKHGVFEQSPNGHLTTNGCYACGKENSSLLQRSNKTAFVEKAQKVHNFEFDYSLVDYKNSDTKVDIICKKHGVFSQRPNKHLVGDGCPDCKFEKIASIKRFTKEQFVQKAKRNPWRFIRLFQSKLQKFYY